MMETEYQMAVQRTHDAYCKTVIRHAANPMTSEEKKLLQAKHRLEEAQARDRVKERKARTRRLIQEGAVLEKVLPEVQAVGLDNLEEYLWRKLTGHD